MSLILPNNGDSVGGKIIAPNANRPEAGKPTRRLLITSSGEGQKIAYQANEAHATGSLRFAANHEHIMVSTDRGWIACANCGTFVAGIGEEQEDRNFVKGFIEKHKDCPAASVETACSSIVIQDD